MAGITDAQPTEDEAPHTVSEDTPLLPGGDAGSPVTDDEDPRSKYKWPVIIGSFSIIFMIELAVGISTPAWNALLEKGLCAEAYPEISQFLTAGDENPLCKDPAVQGKLALYRGWSYTFECLPTIVLALPLGSLSDRWGRKPIAILALVGVALSMLWYEVMFYFPLPMWTFILSFVFQFIGGGAPVGLSMLYTMLADVLHVEEMTTVLFRFFSVFLVAELVGNPLGGFLLSRGPWVSLITGNVFIVLVLMSLYILPETLVVRRWHDAKAGKTPSPRLAPLDGSDDERLKKSSISAALDDARDQLVEVWEFLIGNKRIVVLMLPLIFMTLGKYIQEMLLQYATKRYGWSWSKATYFLTLKSASFIIMLTVILPAVSSFCLKRLGMSPLSKDLWLSRWSGVMLVVADLAVAFSFTPALFGAGLVLLSGGCGLTPLLRSLLNAQVEPHHVGILNTLLGFLDTLGVMIAAPIFSESLNKGIELGGAWIGLPFVAGAVISCFAAGILWVYRIPPQVERSVLEEDHV
ncbi:tp synthase f0 [Diaporthe amygdali]|uniref:tp synthase f0 n=1 Tax=Phomopsis amygdali TaxID=1214568 RepID=UPI0022FDF01F|nr:tp synthase f0 [Diaporthe amygdali]KAJ0103929.1 tp synthase f0 [Diaporthe amygdali]